MIRAEDYRPAMFSPKGIHVSGEDYKGWWVVWSHAPNMYNPVQSSDFEVFKEAAEGDNGHVVLVRNWASPVEVLLVKEDTEEYKKCLELHKEMDNYPILDEERYLAL